MACRIDSPVLVVSTLAAFFATFFAVLLLLRESPDERELQPLADPQGDASVDAGPPEPQSDPTLETSEKQRLQQQLEALGVRCADDANCYSD